MIDVVLDAEGVRMALEEIFEEDFARSRIEHNAENASQETRDRMEKQIPPRTLSPGYYGFASHLLRLEDERKAGVALTADGLADFEVSGLVALLRARETFERRHPACPACSARQQGRFATECHSCGAKFACRGM